MEILVTIIAFILIFGLLIFVHELGHFVVAKRNGVKVEEFAFGLPLLPKIFGIKRGETEYSIYPVPLGGFVKMLGEDGASKSSRSFAAKSTGVRARILIAGVAMNFLLALALLTVGFLFKMPPLVLCASDYPNASFENKISITAVTNLGPAKDAGIQAGDVIKKIDGTPVACSKRVPETLSAAAGTPVALELERDGVSRDVTVTPKPKGDAAAGQIGIAPRDEYKNLDYPWWEAPYLALIESLALITATVGAILHVFATLFTQANVPVGVSGPVGIAKLTGYFVEQGALAMLRFVALLSLSLAVFNLLPIPALDGGRLLFVIIERLRGKPVSAKTEQAIHTTGFFLLIAFILVITYFDLTR